MSHVVAAVKHLRGCRVVVLGDVMLDEYMHGVVSRISPEAPVPVLEVRGHDRVLGGAANTAANLRALGGAPVLVGVVGTDEAGDVLRAQLAERGIASALVRDPARPTTQKIRIVAQGQQIVRVDREQRADVHSVVAEAVRDAVDAALRDAGALVVSDYAMGVVTGELARHAIRAARARQLPIVVDPKPGRFVRYAGATVVTPNLHELATTVPAGAPFDIARAAGDLVGQLGGTAVLVTQSAAGMTLFQAGAAAVHVPAGARQVQDVVGAGDTVVATLALALASGVGLDTAVELASAAAAVVVARPGTATVSRAELIDALISALRDAHASSPL